MSETDTFESLTISFSENGIQTTRELDKAILSKGAWSTLLFRYQDWDNKINDFGPVKFSIRRYQKRNNKYQLRSKFNISSKEQANKIIEILSAWVNKE